MTARQRQCRPMDNLLQPIRDNHRINAWVPASGKATGSEKATGKMPDVLVEIYVSENCFVCEYTHEVAATIRREFPTVKVQVIDIHRTTVPIPEQVFATPTYLLNGKVWSLGNPSPEKVTQTLSELVKSV